MSTENTPTPVPAAGELVAVTYAPRVHFYCHDNRAIEIRHRLRDAFGFERDNAIAKVWSARSLSDQFSPPKLSLLDNQGSYPNFTRSQWEAFKREGDRAFDAFEAEWPLSEHEPSLVDGRTV